MIIVIIAMAMAVLGFVLFKLGEKFDYDDKYDFLEPFGAINFALGIIGLFISGLVIVVSHTTIPKIIQQNKMEYDGLCKRYEIVTSEYEDVSKSDVIADITEWNMDVYNKKYWTDNPWTNWFNPREIADNLKYISLEE